MDTVRTKYFVQYVKRSVWIVNLVVLCTVRFCCLQFCVIDYCGSLVFLGISACCGFWLMVDDDAGIPIPAANESTNTAVNWLFGNRKALDFYQKDPVC